MIEAQKGQNGGVQVVRVHLVLDRAKTDLIRGSDDLAPLDAATRHPPAWGDLRD